MQENTKLPCLLTGANRLDSRPMALFPEWNLFLRWMRERHPERITQAQAARIVGRTNKQVSVYEKGTTEPQLGTFEKLLALYGIDTLAELEIAYAQFMAKIARERGEPVPEPVRPHLSPDEELGRMIRKPETWQRFALESMGNRLDEYEKELRAAAEREAARDAEIARLQEMIKRKKS